MDKQKISPLSSTARKGDSSSSHYRIKTDLDGTELFARTIAEYLNLRAISDSLFAPCLQKPNKSLEECVRYILNEVGQSGCCGFADEEIYAMALHYYDEDDLDVAEEEAPACRVVINSPAKPAVKSSSKVAPKRTEVYTQASLFDEF